MLILTLKDALAVPLEAEVLSPDVLAPLAHDAIRALPVLLGKRRHRLEDHFSIEGEGADELELRGDLRRVKWIGRHMTRGRIRIVGSAGMHLGAYMAGGTIEVTGDVTDWLGAEMTAGTIRVQGNAGGQIGSAYRGSTTGMSGGTIAIEGAAGSEIGMRMKRGLIAIRGPVGDFVGLQMKGGTIVLLGGAEERTGAWMQRGTIVSLKPLKLLPTFATACEYNPSFLGVYARHLAQFGFELPHRFAGAYRRQKAKFWSGRRGLPRNAGVTNH